MPREHSKTGLTGHFRVRPVLVRWIVSALCLFLTVLIVPHVYYEGDYPVLSWLIISAVFGLLTTFVKPLVQLVLLPLIFVSYGLVIVLINTLIIWFLAVIFPARLHVDTLVWALVAGLVSGLLIGLLENLFGLTPPIVQGGPEGLKKRDGQGQAGARRSKNCWTRPAAARTSSSTTAIVITVMTRPNPSGPRRSGHEAVVAGQGPRGPAAAAGLQHAPPLRLRHGAGADGVPRRVPACDADLGLAAARRLGRAEARRQGQAHARGAGTHLREDRPDRVEPGVRTAGRHGDRARQAPGRRPSVSRRPGARAHHRRAGGAAGRAVRHV